jgi:hypothetical protein
MLDPITLLALRDKILTMEAERHGFGWTMLPTSVHVISVDGRFLRHQVVPRPHGLVPTDPPHIQVAAYIAGAGTADPLSVVGVPVAACFIAELCPGCQSSGPPQRIRRLWHARWHRPTVRILIAVDVAGARYYLQRDRDDDTDIVLYISTPPQADDDGDSAASLYRAMVGLLATWRRRSAEQDTAPDHGDTDAPSRCRTPECTADPDDGDGWDGFCGDCADRRYTTELDNEQTGHSAAHGNPPGAQGGAHHG